MLRRHLPAMLRRGGAMAARLTTVLANFGSAGRFVGRLLSKLTCILILSRRVPKPFFAISLPHRVGFAREHCASRQRGRLWIAIQDPANEIGRQPGKMD